MLWADGQQLLPLNCITNEFYHHSVHISLLVLDIDNAFLLFRNFSTFAKINKTTLNNQKLVHKLWMKSMNFCLFYVWTWTVCGVRGRNNRIVGGKETSANQYPWMVGLYRNNRLYCGGALISNKHVLTAAHCIHNFDRREIQIYFGMSHTLELRGSNEWIYDLFSIFF